MDKISLSFGRVNRNIPFATYQRIIADITKTWITSINETNTMSQSSYFLVIIYSLGPNNGHRLLHTILILAKYNVYKNRYKGKAPTLAQLQNEIEARMTNEGYIAMCNHTTPLI